MKQDREKRREKKMNRESQKERIKKGTRGGRERAV